MMSWRAPRIGRTAEMAELEIRAADREDLDGILDLVRASLGEGRIPRSREFWEWKHRRNPFGESAVLVAQADGRLVGLRVFMRWAWRRDDVTYRAVRAVDTATHPDWQGRGIFSRLTKALADQMRDEGVHFIFNTPNAKSRPGYLKMGWGAVGRTDLLIAPVRPFRVISVLIRRGAEEREAEPETPFARTTLTLGELCDLPELPRLLDSAESAMRGGFRTPRSVEYLRWRYADVPGFEYRALAEVDGQDGAAIVFRYRRDGGLLQARICDAIVGASSRSAAIAGELIRRLHRDGDADYLAMMSTARRPGILGMAVRGFVPAYRLGPILTVRPLNAPPEMAELRSRASWNPSIGDLELF